MGRLAAIDRWIRRGAAAGFVTPMLVIHGENDYRVPVHAGACDLRCAQAKGVPARLVVYPDENHWVLKPAELAATVR